MKTTFTLSNLTDEFYNGFGESITGLLNMPDNDKFAYLSKSRATFSNIKMKVGNGQFRDQVELNALLKQPHSVTFKLEPRRGYKLATFTHSKVQA
jgi:hypothetical protein